MLCLCQLVRPVHTPCDSYDVLLLNRLVMQMVQVYLVYEPDGRCNTKDAMKVDGSFLNAMNPSYVNAMNSSF